MGRALVLARRTRPHTGARGIRGTTLLRVAAVRVGCATSAPAALVRGPLARIRGPGGLVRGAGGLVRSVGGVVRSVGGVVRSVGGVVRSVGGVVRSVVAGFAARWPR